MGIQQVYRYTGGIQVYSTSIDGMGKGRYTGIQVTLWVCPDLGSRSGASQLIGDRHISIWLFAPHGRLRVGTWAYLGPDELTVELSRAGSAILTVESVSGVLRWSARGPGLKIWRLAVDRWSAHLDLAVRTTWPLESWDLGLLGPRRVDSRAGSAIPGNTSTVESVSGVLRWSARTWAQDLAPRSWSVIGTSRFGCSHHMAAWELGLP